MAKTKGKGGGKPGKTQKQRKTRSRKPKSGGASHALTKAVLSQWDAFSVHANGAKQFDANSSLTNTFRYRTIKTLTTDANGSLAFQVTPIAGNSTRTAAAITSDIVSTDGSWAGSSGGGYISGHEAYRIVSFGVRIFTVANVDACAGILRINTVNTPLALAAYADIAADCHFVSLTGGCDVKWFAKPRGTHIHDFIDGSASIAGLTAATAVQGMPTTNLDLFVSGGPASTPLLGCEIVVNYELLPVDSDLNTSQTASKAWPHMPKIVKAVADVASNHPAVVESAAVATAVAADTAVGGGFFANALSAAMGLAEGVGSLALELAPLGL